MRDPSAPSHRADDVSRLRMEAEGLRIGMGQPERLSHCDFFSRNKTAFLEIELQGELDLPRGTRGLCVAERTQRRVLRRVDVVRIQFQRRRLRAYGTKIPKQIIDVVQYVEELRSEFEMRSLGGSKLFDQRCVPGCVAGALDGVAPGVAECSLRGVVDESAGVEQRP